MAKAKRMYGCTECGATFPKWAGQCGECGAWNTLVETVLESGDEVFFVAATPHVPAILRALRASETPIKRVMIAGGGNIGFRLASRLETDFEVKVIEKRREQRRETVEHGRIRGGESRPVGEVDGEFAVLILGDGRARLLCRGGDGAGPCGGKGLAAEAVLGLGEEGLIRRAGRAGWCGGRGRGDGLRRVAQGRARLGEKDPGG